MSILRHLPDDSALARLGGHWPINTHIAVRTLEEIHEANRIAMRVAGVAVEDLPPSLHIPRPGSPPPADAPAEAKPEPEPEPDKPSPVSWVHQLAAAKAGGVTVIGD